MSEEYVVDVQALETESALQREDVENLQNQVEDLKEENDRLRREAAEMQKSVGGLRKRLVEFLQRSGVRVTGKAAQEAALDLLSDLPGISVSALPSPSNEAG